MTNIVYGIHGIGHGHAMRALTIARSFPQHDFLFVSDRDGYKLLSPEFKVLQLPVNGSPAFQHTMPYKEAVASYFKNLLYGKHDKRKTLRSIESFRPDLAITDYEPNLPWICKATGLTCLSIDHQHIARFGCPELPLARSLDLALLRAAIWMQFRGVRDHMIISFFNTPIQSKGQAKIFPPLLRQQVIERNSSDGDHVLAYHGYSTTALFHKFLVSLQHPVRCYGMDDDKVVKNVTYKKNSTDNFLDDLASCRYVVSTAGHTLLSEALFYGKPVMAFPIRHACEQFLNGYYLEKNGYGLMNDAFNPSSHTLEVFENNLEYYRTNIQATSFFGNEAVFATLDHFFKTKEYRV